MSSTSATKNLYRTACWQPSFSFFPTSFWTHLKQIASFEPCLFIFSSANNLDQSKTLTSSKRFNSLPNDKILDVTKLNAFADDKLNEPKMTISLLE